MRDRLLNKIVHEHRKTLDKSKYGQKEEGRGGEAGQRRGKERKFEQADDLFVFLCFVSFSVHVTL